MPPAKSLRLSSAQVKHIIRANAAWRKETIGWKWDAGEYQTIVDGLETMVDAASQSANNNSSLLSFDPTRHQHIVQYIADNWAAFKSMRYDVTTPTVIAKSLARGDADRALVREALRVEYESRKEIRTTRNYLLSLSAVRGAYPRAELRAALSTIPNWRERAPGWKWTAQVSEPAVAQLTKFMTVTAWQISPSDLQAAVKLHVVQHWDALQDAKQSPISPSTIASWFDNKNTQGLVRQGLQSEYDNKKAIRRELNRLLDRQATVKAAYDKAQWAANTGTLHALQMQLNAQVLADMSQSTALRNYFQTYYAEAGTYITHDLVNQRWTVTDQIGRMVCAVCLSQAEAMWQSRLYAFGHAR